MSKKKKYGHVFFAPGQAVTAHRDGAAYDPGQERRGAESCLAGFAGDEADSPPSQLVFIFVNG